MRKHFVGTCILLAGLGVLAGAAEAQADGLLTIEDVSASSTLQEPGYDHSVWNLLDGNLSTDWSEGAEGGGFEEFVEFFVAPGTEVTGAYINPGFCKTRDLFYKNGAPNRLSISTGGISVDQWMSPYAADYDTACAGLYAQFETPLVSDGVVRITITGVREGTMYEDTCISGLVLYGPEGAAVDPGESDVDPGYTEPAVLPDGEELSEHQLWLYANMAEQIAKRKTDYPIDVSLSVNDLTASDRGFLLYWYQYFCQDTRIVKDGDMNEVIYGHAVNILQEMFPDTADKEKDMSVFHTQYTEDFDGITYRMSATGDFGDAGSWFLDEPTYEGIDDGNLILTGAVCQYNEATEAYDEIAYYQALFGAEATGDSGYGMIHPFRQLSIGTSDYDVLNQS